MAPKFCRGKDLEIGDVITTWHNKTYTITEFENHPGLDGNPARVWRCGDYGVTVFDSDGFFQHENQWIPSHLYHEIAIARKYAH